MVRVSLMSTKLLEFLGGSFRGSFLVVGTWLRGGGVPLLHTQREELSSPNRGLLDNTSLYEHTHLFATFLPHMEQGVAL